MGALNEDDVQVLARTILVEQRLVRLLERAAEDLDDDWEDEVGTDDWATPSEMPIFYVMLEPSEGSWLDEHREGLFYLFASEAEWSDERSVGEPTLYAGAGWAARREERVALAEWAWPATAEASGFQVLADSNGSYVVKSRSLREIVASGDTLAEEAEQLASWARTVMDAVLELAGPPDLDTTSAKDKSKSKRPRTRSGSRGRASA